MSKKVTVIIEENGLVTTKVMDRKVQVSSASEVLTEGGELKISMAPASAYVTPQRRRDVITIEYDLEK